MVPPLLTPALPRVSFSGLAFASALLKTGAARVPVHTSAGGPAPIPSRRPVLFCEKFSLFRAKNIPVPAKIHPDKFRRKCFT
jgi:hypothetical protein